MCKKKEVTKRTLPLLYHTLEFVVENEDLDTNIILRSSGEFHCRHAEGSVAINVYDGFMRCSHLSTDGCWKTETHGLQMEKEQ